MKQIKVMSIFGTRPEAVKMAPVVKELEKRSEIQSIVCVTAQHRQMLDQVLKLFNIKPDYDLDIMSQRQTLSEITARAVKGLDAVIKEAAPDIALVHGDTTTTFAGSLAAFYNNVRTGHVEAGLRTHDKRSPFPEEINRRLAGVLSDLHFAPTARNRENLLREGVAPEDIFVTGNTVIDALKTTVCGSYTFIDKRLEGVVSGGRRVILMTAHRRENLGRPLENISKAVRRVAEEFGDVEVLYPVHMNPAVRDTVGALLGGHERIHLLEPLEPGDMHNIMAKAYMVLTDSGGLQEEAPSLGKPVLVLRRETERPEAMDAGTVRIVGVDEEQIYQTAKILLEDSGEYEKMAHAVNPYGDGKAAQRTVDAILYYFGVGKRPVDFI